MQCSRFGDACQVNACASCTVVPNHPCWAVGWFPTANRLRQYKVLTPAGAYVPAAMPGVADLTLKMKKIDPDQGVDGLQLPEMVSRGLIPAWLHRFGHKSTTLDNCGNERRHQEPGTFKRWPVDYRPAMGHKNGYSHCFQDRMSMVCQFEVRVLHQCALQCATTSLTCRHNTLRQGSRFYPTLVFEWSAVLCCAVQVGSSKLTAKLEYDGHCDHGRISMSPREYWTL